MEVQIKQINEYYTVQYSTVQYTPTSIKGWPQPASLGDIYLEARG